MLPHHQALFRFTSTAPWGLNVMPQGPCHPWVSVPLLQNQTESWGHQGSLLLQDSGAALPNMGAAHCHTWLLQFKCKSVKMTGIQAVVVFVTFRVPSGHMLPGATCFHRHRGLCWTDCPRPGSPCPRPGDSLSPAREVVGVGGRPRVRDVSGPDSSLCQNKLCDPNL